MDRAGFKQKQPEPPRCPYCGGLARHLKSSEKLYQGRDFGPMWVCFGCAAWVGCHPDGTPLGRLANQELRWLKMQAHDAFDPLWKAKHAREGGPKKKARGAGYKWLARQLGIRFEECHIAMFDEDMCRRVAEICGPYTKRIQGGLR
jgi:hypothetical protein